ncbi:hypothetical protein C0992_003730 [Termitomyces sp. T32_za158]|nr:hypothetical protein C0992_003730 [Termitomyces sp. T32_za158]
MPALMTPSATSTLLPLPDQNQHHSTANNPPTSIPIKLWAVTPHPHQNLATSTRDLREHPRAPHPPLRCPTKHPQLDRLQDHQDPRHTTLTKDPPNLHRNHSPPPPEQPPAPSSDPSNPGGPLLPPRWNLGPPPGGAGPPGGGPPGG